MGLIILVVLFEILAFMLYLPYSTLYWPIFALFAYGLILVSDESERNGARSWGYFRNMSMWFKHFNAVQYFFGDKQSIVNAQPKDRLLFVVIGSATNMALVSGFGLHGGMFRNLDICYLMPWVLFKVPIVREILLWSGAVSDNQGQDINGTILGLLRCGKSVCYPLDGMQAVLAKDEKQQHYEIGVDLYNFAKEEKIKLVPVQIENEDGRYSVWRNSMHEFSLAQVGYPFPFMFMPRIFGEDPPPKVDVKIGVPMNATEGQDLETFNKLFFTQIGGIV